MKSVDKSTIHQKPPKVLGNYSIKKDGRNKHLGGKPYRVQTSFQEPESEI